MMFMVDPFVYTISNGGTIHSDWERWTMSERFLTTAEVAEMTRTPVETVRYWRYVPGKGPKSFKVGRRVLYALEDVEAWISEARGTATREIKLSGGMLDGQVMTIKPGITSVWAVDEPHPGRLERVAYEASRKDPTIWTMRSLTKADIAAEGD
jgi:predicted DNA-binding transcriptional regulator AlpA